MAGADGVLDKEEELLIKKVMKKIGLNPEKHPYFSNGAKLNIELVRSNAKKIITKVTSSV